MKNTFEKRVIVSFVLVWGILVLNSIEAASREWHVSLSGNDNDSGTLEFPLRHIQYAANKAQPGDKVIIHEGIYRESVVPVCGGEEGKPIVYQAADGEKVVIKGSEVIKDWKILPERFGKLQYPIACSEISILIQIRFMEIGWQEDNGRILVKSI